EVNFSLRPSSRASNCPLAVAVEAPDSSAARLWCDFPSPAPRLYLLLRQIHLLGRRLRLGRSLCFDCRRTSDAHRRAAADAVSRGVGKDHLVRSLGASSRQPDNPAGLVGLLAAARNLP